MHHYFQTKVASGIAFMAMVTQGFMAQPPMQTFVTLPAAVNASLAPPSLTLISSSAIPADIGDLANPSISPFSLRVLEQLRALPTFDSLTTLTYCPKGSSRRFGILYASAFWYQNLAMDCSILHQEFYSLLTFHLPTLILHDDRPLTQLPPGPEGPRPPDAAGSSEQVSTRTKVKERLALAEQGHWDILAQRLCAAHHELSQRPELSHTPPSFLKTCELACAKATGRCFRAAAQLLTAPTAPPTSVATFNLTKLLFPTLALETSQAREWDKALLRIKNLPLSTLPIITTKAVTHRLMRIRAGAQPGCSRSRNSHLAQVLLAPWGAQAMHGWTQRWAEGRVPKTVASIWTLGHVKALGKPAGGVRPITLFEAPLKLATGVVLDSQKDSTVRALVPEQFGAMLSCGAEQMVHILRTLSSLHPPDSMVFASTDVKNAFGNASRSLVINSVCKYLPAFAHIILPLWGSCPITLHMPIGYMDYESFEVVDGMFQGECLSTAFFCFLLKDAIDNFRAKIKAQPHLALLKIHVLAYVDDAVVVCPKEHFPEVWKLWVDSLSLFKLPVVQHKCCTWIPGALCIDSKVDALAKQSLSGLPVLGSAAQGNFSSFLTSPLDGTPPTILSLSPAAAPCKRRHDAAQELASALQAMMNLAMSARSLHPAWLILVKVLAVKLDYDCRISFPVLIDPFVQSFDSMLRATASSILGFVALPDRVADQVFLPGSLAGLSIKKCSDTVLAAPVASAAQCLYHVVKWINTETPFCKNTIVAAFDSSGAQAALGLLADKEVFVSAFGFVSCTTPDDSLLNLFCSAPPISISGLQGRILKAIQNSRFLKLYETAGSAREKSRLLSASGPGNGACYSDAPADQNFWLLDLDFTFSSLYRLGIDVPSRSGKCQHYSAAARNDAGIMPICNADLTRSPDHFLMCKKGGCINRIHQAIAHLLALFCREAGYDTRLEVVIPEFAKPRSASDQIPTGLSSREYSQMTQGILDVVASHTFDATEFLLDATVRHPMATNSARLAPLIPGAAAINGEHDKHIRYPSSKGRCVTPCAIETWGRLGPSLVAFIDTLSATAQRRDLAHGLPRGNYKQRWLTMLSCTLNKAIARAIFDSLYYSAPSPHSPLDESTVLSQEQVSAALRNASSPYGLRMFPFPRVIATPTSAPVSLAASVVPVAPGMRELFARRNANDAPAATPEEDLLNRPLSEAPISAPLSSPAPVSGAGNAFGLHS